jgi:hypothetical protein
LPGPSLALGRSRILPVALNTASIRERDQNLASRENEIPQTRIRRGGIPAIRRPLELDGCSRCVHVCDGFVGGTRGFRERPARRSSGELRASFLFV